LLRNVQKRKKNRARKKNGRKKSQIFSMSPPPPSRWAFEKVFVCFCLDSPCYKTPKNQRINGLSIDVPSQISDQLLPPAWQPAYANARPRCTKALPRGSWS
jgi:hypothetical protein